MIVTLVLIGFAIAGVVAYRLLREQIDGLYEILLDIHDEVSPLVDRSGSVRAEAEDVREK